MATAEALLEVTNLTKRFGGLTAVNHVDFRVCPGQIVSIIGPNGAGKTTVFNLITGIYRADEGEARFEARSLIGLLPHQIAALGIARTFQTLRLFRNLTCLENVISGQHAKGKSGVVAGILRTRRQQAEELAARKEAERRLREVGLWELRDELAKNLAYGDQKRLEIARALATGPKLLILDEPAGGLNEQETAELMGFIQEIRASGVTVLLIEHDMQVVMGISDEVVVLDNGEKIAHGTPDEVRRDRRVIEAYLGKEEDGL